MVPLTRTYRFLAASLLSATLSAVVISSARAQTPAPASASPGTPAAPDPHAGAAAENPFADSSSADPSLRMGSLVAEILDDKNQPVVGQSVRLGIHFETIAEGQNDSEKLAQTDAAGRVQFDGLAIGSSYNYQIFVDYAGASYSSESHNLGPDVGMRLRLHVFPSTSDVTQTQITTRALYSIEPRDEVFQVQALVRLSNHGPLTFKPRGYAIRLPEGAKAFTDDNKQGARFEEDSGVARLTGSFTPYRHHDLRFRFQIPNTNDEQQSFKLAFLPNAIESRVIVERGRGMKLEVNGFGEVKEDTAPDGRLIVWAQNIATRDGERSQAEVVLSGLPTTGPVRIWVVAGAFLIALMGVRAARSAKKRPSTGARNQSLVVSELEQAQSVLLDELRALEEARAGSSIGPKTYERARQALLSALIQLRQQLAERSGL